MTWSFESFENSLVGLFFTMHSFSAVGKGLTVGGNVVVDLKKSP